MEFSCNVKKPNWGRPIYGGNIHCIWGITINFEDILIGFGEYSNIATSWLIIKFNEREFQ